MNDAARRFWDERAEDDAPHFVDDRLPYGARAYDALFATSEEVVGAYERLLGIDFAGIGTVVEIGCGVGRTTRALAARAGHVVAIDVSPAMLAAAEQANPRLDNATWMLGDGTSLEGVDDSSADACFSHVVFQHVPDPAVTLGYVREIGRVLRPGGWAAFQISNDPEVHRREDASGPTSSPYWLGSAVELPLLREVAAESGLEVAKVVGAGTQFCLIHARRPA